MEQVGQGRGVDEWTDILQLC
eukprot:COSAG03_NODE_26394_length_259_cov_0.956250_1_plen_20_part_01